MKQFLLIVASFFLVTMVSAESPLQVLDHNNNDVSGKTITIYSNDHNAALLEAHLKVKNTGNTDLNVYLSRYNNIVAFGSLNSFCFAGVCYSPTADTSHQSASIPAGATDTTFLGDYYPTEALGVTSVTYTFFDNTSTATTISACVTIIFSVASLELFDAAGSLVNGSVISVLSSDTSSSAIMSAVVKVKNNSGSSLHMYVHRISNTVVPSTMNSFCFGECYPPNIDTSQSAVLIMNKKTDSTFLADYYPYKQGGTTSLTYEFFDTGVFGISLVASVTIEFTLKGMAIPENNTAYVSGPFPNPASTHTTFDIHYPFNGSKAHISIRNMMGQEVEKLQLQPDMEKVVVNTSHLKSGVYMASFIVDGRVVTTEKLIVQH